MAPDTLPDSRLKQSKGLVHGGPAGQFRMNWVPIYCANCGAAGGLVPEENKTFAFWLCDNCFEQYGPIAATMAMPDEVFWAKVREDEENPKGNPKES